MEHTKYILDRDTLLVDALKILDILPHKILFLVDSGHLVGSVTDGDIRRWIIKKGELKIKIFKIANPKPKFLSIKDVNNKSKLINFSILNKINAIPLIDENYLIQDIFFIDKEPNLTFKEDLSVVIMAGGLGTRLYPYTKILPKPLIPVGDLPITEIIMDKFASHGLKNFFLVVNYKKNMIKSYFNEINKDYVIEYAEEDVPLGTGGGLFLLKNKLNSTFILSNCDILVKEDFVEIYNYHKTNHNFVTIITSLKSFKIPYGVIEINNQDSTIKIKEKPEFNFLVNTGVYFVEKEALNFLNENENIGFPSLIIRMQNAGKKIGIFPISESKWFDMGQLDDLEKMRYQLYEVK